MTIPSTAPRRAGPYIGTGTLVSYSFSFKAFDKGDIAVIVADPAGVASTLVVDSTALITLNPDQNVSPGGSVQYAVSGVATALPANYSLVILSVLPYAQNSDLPEGGAYRASSVEDGLDALAIQTQQLDERMLRALTLPPSAGGVSTELPLPEASNVIGWNDTATKLVNYDAADLVTVAAYGTAMADTFLGDGSATVFSLSETPGAIANLDVSIGGVTQVPDVDYFWTGGTTLTMAAAVPNGVTLLARYMRGLAIGYMDSANVQYTAPGTGAVTRTGRSKWSDFINAADYGAVADNDPASRAANSAAISRAIAALPVTGGTVYINEGTKFDLAQVTWRARFELCYREDDDDTSLRGMGYSLGSGERVLAKFTSGYPEDSGGGYVCEVRVVGSIQPTFVADACSLTNATPFLGPGQLLDDPVRMGFLLQDNKTDRGSLKGEYHKDYSGFSGLFLHGWQSATTLTGIGTQDYSVVPALGDPLTGTLSGARGFYLYSEGTAVSLSACRQGNTYTITTAGTTSWTNFGAANNTPGTSFTYIDPNNVSAGAFVVGKSYKIVAAFDTDFTAIGAADNMIGTVFTATADGLAATVPLGTPGLALPQYGTGTCTGARKTVISFQKGRFRVGDALVYPSGTTAATATVWEPLSSRMANIGQGPMAGGAWMVGDRPPGVFTETWNVAGNDCVVPTRNGSILMPKRVSKPKRWWSGNPEVASPYKLGIGYDPGDPLKANAYQRLYSARSDRGGGDDWCGDYVPVTAQINFTNSIAIGLNSVNIKTMTKVPATNGRYAFEFHYPAARSDWSFSIGKDGFYMIGWDVGLVFPTTTGFEIRVYNAAGVLTDIPAGAFVSVTIMGGDV